MTTIAETHIALAEESRRMADIIDLYIEDKATHRELRQQEARVYRAQATLHQALAEIETS